MVGAICGFSARPLRRIVTAPLISTRDRLTLSHRRWPSGKPRSCAFCRSAPAVRFMALAIFLTGDLLRECAFSSRTSAFDQGRRLARLPCLFAITYLLRHNWDTDNGGAWASRVELVASSLSDLEVSRPTS